MARRPHQKKRPSRARRSDSRLVRVVYGPELGPGVVSATLEELETALREQPDDLDWPSVSGNVIPVMPRVRPYPAGFPTPLRVVADPGIAVCYAIDIGPAFMSIGADLLRSWDIPLSEVQARSLANLVERASRVDASAIVAGSVGEAPTRWLQTGESIGSVLVLAPDEIRRIFGSAPSFFITPMRDLIIGLPADVDRELAAWLWLEVASLDPNCLGPVGFRFDGYVVRPESFETFVGTDIGVAVDPAYVA